ncbi:MAG: tetratricopeptide repeat protein [Pseudomonadales bacterium]
MSGSLRTSLVVLAVVGLFGCQSVPLDYGMLTDKISDGELVPIDELRSTFLELEDLSERIERLIELESQAMQLVEDAPLKLGAIGQAILDTYYGSLTGHYVLERFYSHLESFEAATPHQEWLTRIRLDMESDATGSRDQPYPAMTATEAQMYAISLGMSPVGSIYETSAQFPYSMLLQAHPREGGIRNMHFDLHGVYEAMRREFQGEMKFSPFALIGYQAKRGDTAAQAAIGRFLASQNRFDEAINWLRGSSRTGNLQANAMLAQIYLQRASQESDPDSKQAALDEVLENYLHAVALGSTDAMYALGVLYLNEHYGPDNKSSGVPLLKQAAELEHSDAAMFLAHMHYTGEAVERDLDAASTYYVQSSELENAFARRAYARFLLAEQRADPRAIAWLRELARDDDAESMLLLGNLHARGVGVKPSPRRAVGWYKDAVKVSPDDANIVNEVTWTLTVSDLKRLKRARYALTIMDDLMSNDEDARSKPEYLDTWAAAHAANGDFGRAISIQEEAVEAAKAEQYESVREIIEQHLDEFKNGRTITEPAP